MSTVAHDLFALIIKDLDDENAIRTTSPALFLRQITRAQQWVALRYQLLRETFRFSLYLQTPVYALAQTHPRLVVLTHMTHSDGVPLWRVPLTSLRYKDTAWFSTPGAPSLFYRVGWRYVGVYPVPTANETVLVSGVLLPVDLTEMASRLQIQDSYVPHVALVASGLLMISRERRYEEGIARVRQGLGVAQTPATAAQTQGVASVAG